MYTLINGSLKNHASNSRYFLKKVSKYLDDYQTFNLKTDSFQDIIDSIKSSEVIVLAFPLYVDSPNSMTLKLLNYIIDNNINMEHKKIYAIINCGFLEGEQNIVAANIIKNWCIRTKSNYYGSIMIGAGEIVGKKHYKLICQTALKKLKNFSIHIKGQTHSQDIITTMNLLNNHFYCKLANISWKKKMKKNGLKS